MKKTKVMMCAAIAVCLLAACGKKPASTVPGGTNRPAAAPGNQEPQTVTNMRVKIKDITAYAGEPIDYIAAIESAENLEIKRSMIYVDSSAVDSNTPGTYKAVYSFEYMGATVTNSVKVTILENTKQETTAAETQPETEPESNAPAESISTQETGEAASTGETSSASSSETVPAQQTDAAQSTTKADLESISAVVEQELPPAEITLSNGKVVTIKMTASRYITETYTDESYHEEDGFTFLTSELKVLFNTGEVQVVETVVTRVQPQETSTETGTETAE